MKKLISILILAAIISCNTDPRAKLPTTGNFGTAVTEDSLKTVNDVVIALQTNNTFPVKVTGVIAEYCKGEGCWLTLENKGGEALFVEVENKAFVLPHNISGKIAVVDGIAVKEKVEGKEETKILAKGILIK
jgi:TfoX/Sxy family transcriptional regulator of competence genes